MRSEIALPELMPWVGPDGEPDVEVRLGPVPKALKNPVHSGPFAEADAGGTMLVRIDAVARYLVTGRRTVVIDPAPGAPASDVRMFLLGSVLGLLCHLRGYLPLHGACVIVGERAIALVGHAGEGKSTMAAALAEAGHRLLADDITALQISDTSVLVQPTFPRIKLWSDSLAALGVKEEGLSTNRNRQGKYHVFRPEGFAAEPVPLSAIYELRSDPLCTEPQVESIRGAKAMAEIYPHIYRRRLGELAAGAPAIFRGLQKLLREVPYFSITRRRDISELNRLVKTIETSAASLT